MYATLAPDGGFKAVQAKPTLEALQGAVGGYVDVIRLHDGLDMWINDEGKLNGLEPNHIATELARLHGRLFPGDVVVGPVAFTGGATPSGNTKPLTKDGLADLRKVVQIASRAAIARMMATGRIVLVRGGQEG